MWLGVLVLLVLLVVLALAARSTTGPRAHRWGAGNSDAGRRPRLFGRRRARYGEQHDDVDGR